MTANWTLEAIQDLIIAAFLFFGGVLSLKTNYKSRVKSYFYLSLMFIFGALYFLFDWLSLLFLNQILERIQFLPLLTSILMLVLMMNYNLKESYVSLSLIPLIVLGTILSFLAFQPGVVELGMSLGQPIVIKTGLFSSFSIILEFTMPIYMFIWIFVIWINAPYEIKTEAMILFLGGILAVPVNFILYGISLFINPYIVIIANSILIIGMLIILYVIRREPKIFFVLPFQPYKLIVNDRQNLILLERIWSKEKLSEKLVAQFTLATQPIYNGDIQMGLSIMQLKEGVILTYDSHSFIVGLLVSKSSKQLLDLIKAFANELEQKYNEIPKNFELKEASDFIDTLYETYFHIFPSRLIDEEKRPLFIAKEYFNLPPEIEMKVKAIVSDEEEYARIKCEIQRAPKELSASEFLQFYEELHEESEQKDMDAAP